MHDRLMDTPPQCKEQNDDDIGIPWHYFKDTKDPYYIMLRDGYFSDYIYRDEQGYLNLVIEPRKNPHDPADPTKYTRTT